MGRQVRLAYVAVLLAAIPLLAWNGFVRQGNALLYDMLLRLQPPVRSPAVDGITLLAIDDRTTARYGPLPLARSRLAEALERLAVFEPRVLAVDLLLSEGGRPADDQALARALRRLPRLVLSAAIDSDGQARSNWILPLPVFRDSAVTAHVHAAPDADGVVRSVLLAKEAAARRLWALGMEVARLGLGAERPVEDSASVRVGDIRVPAAARESRWMPIHYAGPEGTFARVSFASLIEGTAAPESFRDKIVLLGVTAQGSGDRLFTPVSVAGLGMSGIEIHANVARTILDRAFLTPLGAPGEFLAFALIAGACLLGAGRLRGGELLLLLSAIGFALPAAAAAALSRGWVWPLASFFAVFLVSAAVAGAGEYTAVALNLRSSERKRKDYAFRLQAIAHEIKTPLTAIQGSSEIISDESIPEEKRLAMAGLIHKESKRLTGIIRTFLDVERMAAGAMEIDKQPVALAGLCGEVLERARLYAARKRIEIRSEVPPLTIPADAELLSFAVYNLLTNAVKYSPRETSILLAAGEDGGAVWISVTDQGSGIAPAEQQRIFERFYRLRKDEKSAEEGSGIGLALVKEIVEQHGGRVRVESRPGAGSRFTLALPKDAR